MTIYKKFSFESAHRLPNVPTGHKCGRMHGHSYRVTVYVRGPVQESGMVLDFADLKAAFAPTLALLDHRYLNEIPGLENPTSENMAVWIWVRLAPVLPGLCKIKVSESASTGAVYRGRV